MQQLLPTSLLLRSLPSLRSHSIRLRQSRIASLVLHPKFEGTYVHIATYKMVADSGPMYTDTPLVPMATPKYLTGKDDPFTLEASKMAISHNSFIRGFNSIYQQAPRVQTDIDKSDFVEYCIAWHDCVEAHHRYEEVAFFPKVDQAAGRIGLMDGAVREHALFHDGLAQFKTYLTEKGAKFSSTELIHIMDSFRTALDDHFRAEISMIVGLAEHSTPERPIDILAIADAAARSQITPSLVLNIIPIFYLNMNTAEFEDGMWDGIFPSFKGIARAFVMRTVPLWHARRWRFVSCSPEGRVKHLAV
ncbi:hypothetical protein B0I35DRAFT_424382 [Stachybotrys elegans]|uniref:Hemerythrin-like domain-containing protein n=1 Tax=Stachybotrys elegans TaxID=80388 RepID=A0A8K0WTV3_9HYPO|nr:hypothetical protein B0I35DRAFT_424382 [Stachybotrys elegans]